MSRTTKIIILLAIGLLVILGIIIYFVLQETDKPEKKVDETAPVAKLDVPEVKDKLIKPIESEEEVVAKDVRPVAIAFVERFGTYTNDSNYESIRGIKSIMTPSMVDWTETVYLPKLETEHPVNGFFYRITAKAPVVQVLESSATSAKVKLTTQREEQIGTEKPRAFLQEIILDFINEDNTWLVDAAYWQKEK